MNLGAAVFDNVTKKIFLHYTVGFKRPSGESVMLVSEDFGLTFYKDPNYSAQMRAIGLGAQLNPGPGIGIQLHAKSKSRHRLLICGQGGEHDSSTCIRSDDHGIHWVGVSASPSSMWLCTYALPIV